MDIRFPHLGIEIAHLEMCIRDRGYFTINTGRKTG